ncbi:uncharacterized acetyltransferase-like protein [Tanacetum coccineum]
MSQEFFVSTTLCPTSYSSPLAGRLITDSNGYVYITCNDSGAQFVHADAKHVSVNDVMSPTHVPDIVKGFFTFDRMVSYEGHFNPLLAVQVTELSDGLFVGFSVNTPARWLIRAGITCASFGARWKKANKFDGKISAFPGREGGGSVDLEVVLSPETMAELELDAEFMQYVTGKC